jgi:hypothetical protein
MAFDRAGWRVLAAADVLRLYAYETADDVTTAGYFSPLWREVQTNDLIFVDSGSATTVYRIASIDVDAVSVAVV